MVESVLAPPMEAGALPYPLPLNRGLCLRGLVMVGHHFGVAKSQGMSQNRRKPLGAVAISNPALLDPSLCPPGKLVLHLYGAGNEPFDIWENLQGDAYEEMKASRAQRLWEALEDVIPDARARAEAGTPFLDAPSTLGKKIGLVTVVEAMAKFRQDLTCGVLEIAPRDCFKPEMQYRVHEHG
eukprot:s2805_g7.t1